MRFFKTTILFILFAFTGCLSAKVLAIPQIPHRFYGNVTIYGSPVPDGTLVEAIIPNIAYSSARTLNGTYDLMVPADDPDTPEIEGGRSGDLIYFYVEQTYVTSYTFENGKITKLNLSLPPEYQPSPEPSPSPEQPSPTPEPSPSPTPEQPSQQPFIIDEVNTFLRVFTQPIGEWLISMVGDNPIISFLFIEQPIVLVAIIIILLLLFA